MCGAVALLAAATASAKAGPPDASVTGPPAPPELGAAPARSPRVTFAVLPFENTRKMRALDYLEGGLPALIAERFAQQRPLRFTGGAALLPPRASLADARYRVRGRFERRPDWKIAVTVEILSAEGAVVASGERAGHKDDASHVALEAAAAAFRAVPGLELPEPRPEVTAKFGRDPYAFVLYGRGIAMYVGLPGHPRSPERAKEILARSLVIDPRVVETRRFTGLMHLESGRPGHARAMWAYALDLQPRYAAALAHIAALDRTQGMIAAKDHYETLLDVDPDDIEARRAYGEILSEAGRLDEAERQLGVVLASAPHDLRARRALALVLAARRAGNELVSELETVVRLDPEDLEARMDLGAAYAAIGRVVEASLVYEEVLRRRPRHTVALKLAADMWRQRGELKKAAGYYERLRRLAPTDPRPVFLLGRAYYDSGNFDAAQRMFEEGAQFPGMLGESYSNLGAIALKRGKTKEALWFLSRAAKRRPNKAGVRYNYALALRALDRHADALNELRAAQIADPDDVGVRFLTGVVALRLGLLREAEEAFREALRLDPQNEDARHNLALLETFLRPSGEGVLTFVEPPPEVRAPAKPKPSPPRPSAPRR